MSSAVGNPVKLGYSVTEISLGRVSALDWEANRKRMHPSIDLGTGAGT